MALGEGMGMAAPSEVEQHLRADDIQSVNVSRGTFRTQSIENSHRLVFITLTSMRYILQGEGKTRYLEDCGIGVQHQEFAHVVSKQNQEIARRFPLGWGDMDSLTWQPSGRLRYSLVHTSEPDRVGWDFELRLPFWVIAVILSSPAALMLCLRLLFYILRIRHVRLGYCEICGYDLRGSIDRCPECGTEMPSRQNTLAATRTGELYPKQK
jgi:hypothetical protein